MSYWPGGGIVTDNVFRAELKSQPTSTRDEYITTSYGNGWCGMPDPSAMSSYLLSDNRFRKNEVHQVRSRCCPAEPTDGGEDDWGDAEGDADGDANDDWGEELDPSMEYATRNRSLQVWDGFGVAPEVIDCDAMMRMATEDASLMGRADGRQLSNRVFVAAPSLANKRPDPRHEIAIISGIDTSDTRRCFRLGEQVVDRFDPGVCPIPVNHVVPPWVAGGVFSRDIGRSEDFQKAVRKFSRCHPIVPVGADDPTILSYGPNDAAEKRKTEKTDKKREKKLNKSWCKLETIANGLPGQVKGT